MATPKCSIIICTHNEENSIGKVIVSIPDSIKKQSEIIVVDSSTDMTPKIAKALGAKVIRSKPGKGRQLRLGASKSKGEILVFLDGDGEHPPEYIPKLLKKLNNSDMVIGCREMSNLRISKKDDFNTKMKLIVLKLLSYPIKSIVDIDKFIKVNDSLSGFRAIRRKDWERFSLKSNGYEIEMEINMHAYEMGFKVGEVIIPTVKSNSKSEFLKNPHNLIEIIKMVRNYEKKRRR
ncbi:MAG: glycosyltransferase family 2 protein [Nanoarchaeota archaeon]|nr:glycosyltransferase family 2 protein [Nanoarchaeota archaeon]